MFMRWAGCAAVLLALAGTSVLGCSKPKHQEPAQPDAAKDAPHPAMQNPDHYAPERVSGIGPWTVFRDPGLPALTFEYPGNWPAGVEVGRGESYWQVVILGPRNAEDSYNPGLTVRSMPVQAGGRYADVPSLVDARRNQYAASPQFRMLEDAPYAVAGVSGWHLIFTYVVPLPPSSINAKPTPLQTRLVIFSLGGTLYELVYSADAREYAAHQGVFAHLLQSITHAAGAP